MNYKIDNNLELEIVNFEQAKALKELGFPQLEECAWYSTYLGQISIINYDMKYPEVIAAPTLELVAKWLRTKKKIYVIEAPIIPEYAYDDGNYKFHYTLVQQQKVPIRERGFESWEQALSAGIDAAIEILKKESNHGIRNS